MADGELIFDTKVDNANFEKGIKEIKSKLNNISSSVNSLSNSAKSAFNSMSSAQIGLVNSLDQTKNKITELKSKIDAIEKVKIPTTEYQKLQDKIATLSKEYSGLIDRKKEWESFRSNK